MAAEQRLDEIERRQRVAEALRDLMAVVNSNHDLDEILAEVLAQSSRLLGNDAGAVYLCEAADTDILRVRAALGLEPDHLALRVRLGSPTTGLAVQQGRTLVCDDLPAALSYDVTRANATRLEEMGGYARVVSMGARTDPDLEPGYLEPRVRRLADRFRAVASTPMIAMGRAFGAITLFYAQPRAFSETEVDLARIFAEQAALAIENARLHAEVEQRMRENDRRRKVAEGMRDLLASVNSTRSLDEIMDLVLAQASELLESDAGSVLLLDGEDGPTKRTLSVRASRALASEMVAVRLPLGTAITGVAVERERPVAVSDVLVDHEFPGARDLARYYRAVLAVPLAVRGRVQGAITLYYRQPRAFSREDVSLAQAFADQTALAMENARLHAQAVRRSRDLEALYRADEALHGSLRLDDVLHALADVATDVLRADKTSVHMWDSERQHLVAVASHGYSPETSSQPLVPDDDLMIDDLVDADVFTISDAATDPRFVSPRMREMIRREGIRAIIGARVIVAGQPFGLFAVAFCGPHSPSGDEQRLVQAIAQRAGLAIQNARLFEQAQQVATAEERQRLARELHDAVTQTLFSASLIAEVVPRLWERDPNEGRLRLEELRRLTRGALAEMRTLLLELRPAALVETPFGHLLRQLAEATASRTALRIEVDAVGDELPLPPEVHIALYRIAQEALNNTGKHASASRAEIHLVRRSNGIGMQLSDDGCGFDLHSTRPGRLGLGIMHERARAIGARLRIQSRVGGGTRVHVSWRGASG